VIRLAQRALILWLVIIVLESVHGALRRWLLTPHVGDVASHQVGVLIGSVLVFSVAVAGSDWLDARGPTQQCVVGAAWVMLTPAFEVALGLALGGSLRQLGADYDPARGGLMLVGLAGMALSPWSAVWLRERFRSAR